MKSNVDWELKFAPEYHFSKDGKCSNQKTGNEIRRVLKGYSSGYYVRGKFYTLSYLRTQLQRITKSKSPF